MAAPLSCTSSMFVCASQVLDEKPHQHETRTREVACVGVELTQPRPTKASGTRTNMLRALECLRVASLCQPVHQCVSPHRPLDEPCEWWTNLVAARRSRSTCSTATQPYVCSRASRHLATFLCSCASAQGCLSCAALLLPAGATLTRQQPLLPQHTTSRSPPQALV